MARNLMILLAIAAVIPAVALLQKAPDTRRTEITGIYFPTDRTPTVDWKVFKGSDMVALMRIRPPYNMDCKHIKVLLKEYPTQFQVQFPHGELEMKVSLGDGVANWDQTDSFFGIAVTSIKKVGVIHKGDIGTLKAVDDPAHRWVIAENKVRYTL